MKPQPNGAQRRILHLGTPLYAAPDGHAMKVAYLLAGNLVVVTGKPRRGFLPVRTEDGAIGFVRGTALSPEGAA